MATGATERLDPLLEHGEPDGLYEVIDGRIVEKALGAYECWFASVMFGAWIRTIERTRSAVSSRK